MSIEIIRSQSLSLLDGLQSLFADTVVSDRVAMARRYASHTATPKVSALSAFLPAREVSAWRPEVTLTDVNNIIKLAHRNGLIDDASYIHFKQWNIDAREMLRGEKVADAITMLQRELDAYARRTR